MTFTTASVTINGIQVSAEREYTTQSVLDEYQTNMSIIQNFMGATTPPGNDTNIGAHLLDAITALRNLAINGLNTELGSSGIDKTYYLTTQMAGTLDFLFKSLEAVGVDVTKDDITTPTKLYWFQDWYNLGAGTPLLQNVFTAALTAEGSNSSLQSMVELQYVKNANDLLGEKMGDLQSALQLTSDSLGLLTNLQNLHNLIQVSNRPPFSTFLNIYNSNTTLTQYTTAASAYFAMPLVPTLTNDNWQIPSYLGFLNYITNIAGAAAGNSINSSTNTLVLNAATNALMPQAFINQYGLVPEGTNPSGNPPVFTYAYDESLDLDNAALNGFNAGSVDSLGLDGGILAFFNIKYTSAIGTGATFTGTTTQPPFRFNPNIEPGVDVNFVMSASNYLGLKRTSGALGIYGEIQNLVTYRNALSAQIATLHTLNPQGSTDSNSLETRLRTVLTEISAVFKTSDGQRVTKDTTLASAYAGFKLWMLDQYGSGSNTAGQIQQDLTNAVSAGQSLNSTQQENVRNFLFIFEEFYKSASAILQTLTQIIERMAQGLARS